MFGDDAGADAPYQPIQCSGGLKLAEVRIGQWRAGVWTDPANQVRWVCAAGLAKGNHRDHDDFYIALEQRINIDETAVLPEARDHQLLREETGAARLLTWEKEIQVRCLDLVTRKSGPPVTAQVPHPLGGKNIGGVTLDVVRDDELQGHEYHVEVILDPRYRGTDLAWLATLRILTSISPPHQGWDRTGDLFVALEQSNHRAQHVDRLTDHVRRGELMFGEPGTVSHYAHRSHLVENTVEGSATRALCGVFFVPVQDYQLLPPCPRCTDIHGQLPAG